MYPLRGYFKMTSGYQTATVSFLFIISKREILLSFEGCHHKIQYTIHVTYKSHKQSK